MNNSVQDQNNKDAALAEHLLRRLQTPINDQVDDIGGIVFEESKLTTIISNKAEKLPAQ